MRFSTIIMITAALTASAAFAQQPDRRPGGFPGRRPGEFGRPLSPVMKVLDANGDGELSAAELAKAPEVLKELDKNGDGKLTDDEFSLRSLMRQRFGQSPGGSRPGSTGTGRLSGSGLKVGSPLPNVAVFDSKGKELKIASLKGDYTVLVFGCLT